MAPSYIASTLTIYHPARPNLRSASDTTRLTVHKTTKLLQSAERRTFYYTAPSIWNDLPIHIRESPSVAIFKKALKTHLYSN